MEVENVSNNTIQITNAKSKSKMIDAYDVSFVIGIAFTRTLNLGRLVTSQLNPLKACSNDVAECFVNSAHQHQISYCRTVLERNQAATIPLVSGESMSDFIQDSDNLSPRQLESFFPFDPFCLRR